MSISVNDPAYLIEAHTAGRAASQAAHIRRTYPEGRVGAPAPNRSTAWTDFLVSA